MKIDLHVHSKYSTRPSQWVLQKIGCPESFTDPRRLRDIALGRGMGMVTITDHNSIEGALDIAHLPNVFVSEEITTYFPEDGCKIHVLAFNISESQHLDIQKARGSIFDLVAYLRQEGIVHVVAHPLYSTNDRMNADHFEQLLLLFKNFEVNGARDDSQNRILQAILGGLGPKDMERLADKHGIYPDFEEPWKKHLTGGSDDHSSLTIASTCTEVMGAKTLGEFLRGISEGQCRHRGGEANPLTLAHTLYSIAYQFYRSKFGLDRYVKKDIFIRFLDGFLGNNRHAAGITSRLYFFVGSHRRSKMPERGAGIKRLLQYETQRLLLSDPSLLTIAKQGTGKGGRLDEKWFDFVHSISNKTLLQFLDRFMDQLSGANVFDIFSSLGSAGALYSLLAPYFLAFSLFARDRAVAEAIGERFSAKRVRPLKPCPLVNVAHFTDTYYEINGIAATLRQQIQLARKTGRRMTILTCECGDNGEPESVINFTPIGVHSLPEYPEQKLFYPPFLEMLRFCYEQRFTHLHSATPGPIGLAALGIAHILKVPVVGTYHTSLPEYARYLTEDPSIEDMMWKYVLWYYRQMDIVYVPSESTGDDLIRRGLPPAKVRLFPRGVDTDRFHPAKRDLSSVHQYGGKDAFRLLYVGRVSKEKDLPLLVDVYKEISSSMPRLVLLVAGDGPYLEEMKRCLEGTRTYFTGYLSGDSLARLYASCDLFVFPSATDTFGNVVLEAQASGLPVIVTDSGGPRENVIPGETGIVVPAGHGPSLCAAIRSLVDNPKRLRQMGRAGRLYAEGRPFEGAFEQAWREMYGEESGDAGRPEEALAGSL